MQTSDRTTPTLPPSPPEQPRAFIIHVRGDAQRFEHMGKVLPVIGGCHEFILDGNKEDLTPSIINNTFTGRMQRITGATSCAYKHILAYRRILDLNIPRALILEDDIIPLPTYETIFPKVLLEIDRRVLSNYLLSLENSGHVYIPKSERIADTLLYRRSSGRCAGAYLIDRKCAQTMLRRVQEHRMEDAVDWFHNKLIKDNSISCYWLDPPVFEQASNNGHMDSLLETHKKNSVLKRITHAVRRDFRRMVASFR